MRHRWSHDTETGLSTCERCGFTVKTYRVKHGGVGPCNPQIPPIPECLDSVVPSPLVCSMCPGRLNVHKCDEMRVYHKNVA